MSDDTIRYEQNDRVAIITLNRPDRLNAISRDMIREIGARLDHIETDDDVAAVVLNGAGRAFSAGMDLKDDAAANVSGAKGWRKILSNDLDFIMRFWDFPKPTIAVVHGYCMAAAFDIAIASDITVAEKGTIFGTPELMFGSVIEAMIMPHLTGPKIAKEFMLTGADRISAERMRDLGLVNHVTAEGRGLAKGLKIAERIAILDDDAVQRTKLAINRSVDAMGLRKALAENLKLGIEIEAIETPSRTKFKEISNQKGLKAALKWRATRLKKKTPKR